MPNPFRKFVVSFELEQLSSMVASARSALERQPPGFRVIAQRHLDRAVEQHDDAITSLRYNNFGQAENMLKDGLMHAYFAFRLAHGKAPDDLEKPTRKSESEEKIAYLGATLAALKSAIEFSNCRVTDLARGQIEQALRLYNEALEALKNHDKHLAKRAAQAGLLQVSFAGGVVGADNGNSLPMFTGLANPLTNSPVRKLNQLAATILQIHLICSRKRTAAAQAVQSHLNRAIARLEGAIQALSMDNVVHAQALVVSGLDEIFQAQELLEPDLSTSVWEDEKETDEFRRRFNATNVELLIEDIKKILLRSTERACDRARNHADALLKDHSAAIRALDSGNLAESERLIGNALEHANRIRQELFKQDGSLTVNLS